MKYAILPNGGEAIDIPAECRRQRADAGLGKTLDRLPASETLCMTPIDLLVIVAVAAFVAFAFWSNRRHHKDRIDAQKTSKAKRLDACANKLRQDSPVP